MIWYNYIACVFYDYTPYTTHHTPHTHTHTTRYTLRTTRHVAQYGCRPPALSHRGRGHHFPPADTHRGMADTANATWHAHHVGVSTLITCSASKDMPSLTHWGVTAVFPQLAAKAIPKFVAFAKTKIHNSSVRIKIHPP